MTRPAGEGLTDEERYDRGMAVRREVLSDAHVDRAQAATTEFTADFQDLITRYAWGEVWARPGLDRRTRSCITITALVATAGAPARPGAGRGAEIGPRALCLAGRRGRSRTSNVLRFWSAFHPQRGSSLRRYRHCA